MLPGDVKVRTTVRDVVGYNVNRPKVFTTVIVGTAELERPKVPVKGSEGIGREGVSLDRPDNFVLKEHGRAVRRELGLFPLGRTEVSRRVHGEGIAKLTDDFTEGSESFRPIGTEGSGLKILDMTDITMKRID